MRKMRAQKPNLQKAKRNDGYVNVMNKYGTKKDNSESYFYEREPIVPDMQLTSMYESNGLFSKIIDTPAEEALKRGYDLNLNNDKLERYVEDTMDSLEWEDKATTAIKWARLYGGAIIVMLIDDGRGLDEPVNWENVRSIDELRVFERAVVQPDYASLYLQDYGDGLHRNTHFGEPEFYYVNSMYGSFIVHESRCLVFRNGVLPEQVSNSTYQMWGMPEYVRIKRALRETVTAHGNATKLLERSVQAVYSMKNLSALLSSEDGEEKMLKRLDAIDMAKGILNTVAIDGDGETYDFKTFQFNGVKDVIDSTCNLLSALTNIPQTLLFGRSPAGMNATGESDLENYYNYVERIQKLMLKKNLRYLLDFVFKAGIVQKAIDEIPDYKLTFKPLWSLSETEQAALEQQKAVAALTKAQATQIYVDMQALDASEVRSKLASEDEYNVEDIIDDDDDIYKSVMGEENTKPVFEKQEENKKESNEKPNNEPDPNQKEQPISQAQEKRTEELAQKNKSNQDGDTPTSVGVLVIKDGRMILAGIRCSGSYPNTICGPGGFIKEGETAEQTAIRETQQEFGITPTELIPITLRTGLAEEYGTPAYFLCTKFDGEIHHKESAKLFAPQWFDLNVMLKWAYNLSDILFAPFADSLRVLGNMLEKENENNILSNNGDFTIIKKADGGPGSGNHGHSGRPGQVGGSGGGNSNTTKNNLSEMNLLKDLKITSGRLQNIPTFQDKKKKSIGILADRNSNSSTTSGNVSVKKYALPSGNGYNVPCKGFKNKTKLKDHFIRHGLLEFRINSPKDYEKQGIKFLAQPCKGDVVGYITEDGKINRFNKVTTEYATGYPNGQLCTYMLAKYNKKSGKIEPKKALAYYKKRKKVDI